MYYFIYYLLFIYFYTIEIPPQTVIVDAVMTPDAAVARTTTNSKSPILTDEDPVAFTAVTDVVAPEYETVPDVKISVNVVPLFTDLITAI